MCRPRPPPPAGRQRGFRVGRLAYGVNSSRPCKQTVVLVKVCLLRKLKFTLFPAVHLKRRALAHNCIYFWKAVSQPDGGSLVESAAALFGCRGPWSFLRLQFMIYYKDKMATTLAKQESFHSNARAHLKPRFLCSASKDWQPACLRTVRRT
jgi:hypothetical protein